MLSFAIRRILHSLPMLLISTIVVFMLMHLAPGDPAMVLAGPEATAEELRQVRISLGLDRPLYVQYFAWLAGILQGDMGTSILSGHPVTSLLAARIPGTVQLAVAGMLLSLAIAFPLGISAAMHQNSKRDYAISTFNTLAIAVPGFWIGILGITVFSVKLGWLPAGGMGDFSRYPLAATKSFVLPTLTLALTHAASTARYVRNSMLEVLQEDYVRTAFAKGLSTRRILMGHTLRNALIPIVPFIGLQFGNLLGGLIVIEIVFAWPGLGRLMLDAIGNRDYAVVQGGLLFLVFLSIFVGLAIDLIHGALDPRVQY